MRDFNAAADAAPKLNRRTVLKGAAWSVPVIAVASAVPAYAASATCTVGEVIPVAQAQWNVTAGALSSWDRGGTGWTPIDPSADIDAPNRPAISSYVGEAQAPGFLSQSDGSTTETVVVATFTFTPVEGATYSISTEILSQTAFGTGQDPEGYAQWLDVDVIDGGAGTPLAREIVHRKGGPTSGYDLTLQYGGSVTRSLSFTATTSSTISVQFTFHLAAMPNPKPTIDGIGDVNSDFWVTAPLVTVEQCPA